MSLVSSGSAHTACITADGQLYTFGCGDDFRLGHVLPPATGACWPNHVHRHRHVHQPRAVACMAEWRVVDVACGATSTAAVTVRTTTPHLAATG